MAAEDIEIRRSGEFHVAHIEGQTDEGIDFIDSYFDARLIVVDSGRIILPNNATVAFKADAQKAGLGITDGEPLL